MIGLSVAVPLGSCIAGGQSVSYVRASAALSPEPSHSPSGTVTPSVLIPSATMCVCSAILNRRRVSSPPGGHRPGGGQSAPRAQGGALTTRADEVGGPLRTSTRTGQSHTQMGCLAQREDALFFRACNVSWQLTRCDLAPDSWT